jgi:hypothetical protein
MVMNTKNNTQLPNNQNQIVSDPNFRNLRPRKM